jgi:hypothetical protein
MMTKRFGGLWRFLVLAMLLCAFMTVVWSDGVKAAPPSTTLTISAGHRHLQRHGQPLRQADIEREQCERHHYHLHTA